MSDLQGLEVEHLGRKYELDVETSIKNGTLKEVKPPRVDIVKINAGDVFKVKGCFHTAIWAIQVNDHLGFMFAGCTGTSTFSNSCYNKPMSKGEALNYLNRDNYILIGNIEKAVQLAFNNVKSLARGM